MSAFLSATGVVALAEIGDKTQIATAAMAATQASLFAVVAGSTLGMMIANVPAVLVGERLLQRVPLKWVRVAAAVMFAGIGVAILAGAGAALGF